MSIFARLRDVVGEDERSQTETQVSTRLYRCDPCDITIVNDSQMDTCSRCDSQVEPTPTANDLGI